MTLSEHLVIGE